MQDESSIAPDPAIALLGAALSAGDRRALGRAISLVEAADEAGDALCRQLRPAQASLIVGFTGTPGAGKSTLISAYTGWLRAAGRRVAVLAIDPTSPFTGGAILGDRIRMIEHLGDAGVFVRSLATRGHPGGLTATTDNVLTVVEAAGWDVIILETVGVGQAETDMHAIADVGVLVTSPSQGDDVQAMKAGVLETADIIVVNKNDLPGADDSYRHLKEMTRLADRGEGGRTLLRTSAISGDGLNDLGAGIDARRPSQGARDKARVRRRILAELERRFRSRLAAAGQLEILDIIARATQEGELSIPLAADQLEAELADATRPGGSVPPA